MKKTIKKIVKKKVSPIPESVKGIKLEHFNLQDRSEFKVKGPIWFQFHYDNLRGSEIAYGSMGLAIHKWTGSKWKLHNYKSSYGGPNGKLRSGGGPGGGPAHEDHWVIDGQGVFALTPYVSFDKEAIDKIKERKDPGSVADVSLMAMPTYISIDQAGPNGVLKDPPAPLFAEKFVEEEIEEEIEVPDDETAGQKDTPAGESGHAAGEEDQPKRVTTAPGSPDTGAMARPPRTIVPAQSMAADEVSRQAIDWHAGSGVGAVRIELSRRQGDQWLVHTALTQALDDDNRVEVIFLEAGE